MYIRSCALTGLAMGALVACGGDAGETRLVELGLALESSPPQVGSLSDFSLPDGWLLHLDEAKVQLASVYLRAPRRKPTTAWWRVFVPVARAHSGHAQTLTEGQVIGEYLDSVELDGLSEAPLEAGMLSSEDVRLDRLSVVLGRGAAASGSPVATVRGRAERDGLVVNFACALRIEQDADEAPENLEERRRVDQIYLEGAPQITGGATLRLRVHVWRWLERVDFGALVGQENPCASPGSPFMAQWYLGIRRPEAFSADLVAEE